MNDMRKLMEIATEAGGLDPWGVPTSKDDLKEQLKTLVFVAREKHGLPEAADYLEQIIADNF